MFGLIVYSYPRILLIFVLLFRPCPAINTLANHGFIPRDGVVDVIDLGNALQQVYRVRNETLIGGPIQSAINFGLTQPCMGTSGTCLSIDQLGQNEFNSKGAPAQEHDSSHFREDSVGDDLGLASSPRLVDAFFDMQTNIDGSLNIQEVMAYQRGRIEEGCNFRNTTDLGPRTWTGPHRGGAAIQGALLFVLAQAEQGKPLREQSSLRSIVADETLPAGYCPDEDILFTFQNNVVEGDFGCHSDGLRDAFRQNVDKTLCTVEACADAAADIDCEAVLEGPSVMIVPLDPRGIYSPHGC